MVDDSNVDDSVMDGDKLRSSFASKIHNVDGKILGKDGKPMRRAIRFVEPARVSDPPPVAHANVQSTSPLPVNGNSFAAVLQHQNFKKVVKVSKLHNNEKVQGAAVAIPLEAVKEVSARFDNTLYGYFVGKKLAFPLVENYVKNTWMKFGLERVMNKNVKKEEIKHVPVWVKLRHVPVVAYSEVGLSLITTLLGKPIMLDSYTCSMCINSWGKSDYARALIQVTAEVELAKSVVVAIPFLDGTGHSLETVDVEYEWTPPRCGNCCIFDHTDDQCPKKSREDVPTNGEICGIRLSKPMPNYYYRRVERGETSKNRVENELNPVCTTLPKEKEVDMQNSFEVLMEENTLGGNDDTTWLHAKQSISCPKKSRKDVPTNGEADGFVEVKKKKKAKGPSNAKQIGGICLSKPMPNYYYRRVVRGETSKSRVENELQPVCPTQPKEKEVVMQNSFEVLMKENTLGGNDDTTWLHVKQSVSVINESDSEEVDQVIKMEQNTNLVGSTNSKGASTPVDNVCESVFKYWDWTSNGSLCHKGTRILLAWNCYNVDVMVISQCDQAIHTRIWFKVEQKEVFCTFIYAHNRYIQRRVLWENLCVHNSYVRSRPWCLLGDFNAALFLSDSTAGSLSINIAMREFKNFGLQFTWNQKPKGFDGILKKLDRVLGNLEFSDAFRDAHAVFHPYRMSDHSLAILMIPGSVTTKPKPFKFSNILMQHARFNEVPNAFIEHYEVFLGQAGITHNLNLQNLFGVTLDEPAAFDMVRNVSSREVKEVMFSMGNDKSPGPDGYTAAFFKEAWDIVGNDVVKAVGEFFTNDNLLKELNHTVIDLIPKVKNPLRVNDYRPISCCNVLFKCISKIISNRIKESLKLLISPNQSAFVPGRSISDNILLTQELMHNYHLDRGVPRCAFKIDIQKAYDMVDWDFLNALELMHNYHLDRGVPRCAFKIDIQKAYDMVDWDFLKLVLKCFGFHDRMILPFDEVHLPVKYLGVPLVSSRLVFRDCKELIEKVECRLNDWKNKSLSIAGGLGRGKAKVAWDVVCLPKDEGGLGSIAGPSYVSSHDLLVWRDRMKVIKPFSVNEVWQAIRPMDTKVDWSSVV
nr:RNA-directed DNA polymerase, eukaryota, reverse transcriptase zinc-binding domain protein [Tanacetum cinerariifolium]